MVKRREERFYCRIDMSAFAAVLIVLLSAMTIIAINAHPPSSPLPLPHCIHSDAYPKANKEDAISVGVSREGSVYYRGDRVTSDQLSIAIRDAVSRGAEPEVYIYADNRAKYGAILQTVNAAERAGVTNVALMTQPFKPEPFNHPLF